MTELAIQWDLAIEQKEVEAPIEQGDLAGAKKVAERDCAPAHEVCSVIPPGSSSWLSHVLWHPRGMAVAPTRGHDRLCPAGKRCHCRVGSQS